MKGGKVGDELLNGLVNLTYRNFSCNLNFPFHIQYFKIKNDRDMLKPRYSAQITKRSHRSIFGPNDCVDDRPRVQCDGREISGNNSGRKSGQDPAGPSAQSLGERGRMERSLER